MSFTPNIFLSNKHLQTIYATLWRKRMQLATVCEVFELEDGDFVDCYWLDKPDEGSDKPIVLLFHGLEGCHLSPYIQGAMKALQKAGYASVLMHFRGCSGRENRLPKTYHSGATDDAKAWLAHVQAQFPHAPLFAVGYSIGGNMLLKLLGEYGQANMNTPLKAAIAVSVPMDLNICADTIEKGIARMYQHHLLKPLKRTLLNKYQQHDMQGLIQRTPEQIKKITSLREFDNAYTAKINGFKDTQDYYNKSSSKQFLPYIQTNTLVIHSLDDPFMTPAVLPQAHEVSNKVELEIHSKGGHVGFVMGNPFNPVYYLEERIVSYFEQYNKRREE